jgi:DNA replication protein DnaC
VSSRPDISRRRYGRQVAPSLSRRAKSGSDEVGYIPFAPEAAALFFALVSSRYERASLIVSSHKPFSAWAEIFGDPVAVAAMVDRLVHHAEIISLKGDSYRVKDRREEVDASG